MSVHVSSAVWAYSQASGSGFTVLLALADQANDEGWCWPSVNNITIRARLDERAVRRRLDWLEKNHEITRHYRPGRSTMYRVEVEYLLTLTPVAGTPPASLTGLVPEPAPPVTGTPPPLSPGPPRTVREPSRNIRGAATRLPDGWQPNDSHRERAEKTGVDIDTETEKFKAHAEANDRRQVRWDATFTTWLINAAQFSQRNGHRPSGDDSGSYSPWSQ